MIEQTEKDGSMRYGRRRTTVGSAVATKVKDIQAFVDENGCFAAEIIGIGELYTTILVEDTGSRVVINTPTHDEWDKLKAIELGERIVKVRALLKKVEFTVTEEVYVGPVTKQRLSVVDVKVQYVDNEKMQKIDARTTREIFNKLNNVQKKMMSSLLEGEAV